MRQIHKALQEVFDNPTRQGIAKAFIYLFKNQPLIQTVMSSGANPYFTMTPAWLGLVDGVTVQLPTSTHLTPAGTLAVPNSGANIAVYGWAVDKFANVYAFGGQQNFSNISSIIWPTPPDQNDGPLPFVYAVLTNGSAGAFTPGTTNTNTASLAWQFVSEFDAFYAMNNIGQT